MKLAHTCNIRPIKLRALLSSLLLLTGVATQSPAQNLVTNGNFAVNGGDFTSTSAPPWSGSGSGSEYFVCVTGTNCNGGFNSPPVGPAFLWITPGAGGGAAQTVNLTTSGLYRFSFYHEANGGVGPPFTLPRLKVTVGGQTLFNAVDTATTWTLFSTTLKLTAGANAVDFIGTFLGGLEGLISDVSLILLAQNPLTPLLPQGAPLNVVNVAGGIDKLINNGGLFTGAFQQLGNLSGQQLVAALTSLSGEAATGAQYGAFQLGNGFFALMLDPLVYGRGPSLIAPAGAGPMRLAAQETQSPEIALAYAKILKEPPAPAAILWEPRWNAWAGSYGGTSRTQGDPWIVGSHDVTARTGGYGAGIDYRIGPGTTVGVALAGGLTNWGLASGLGGGSSDAFQAGLYGITRNGSAYVAGALAFAEHWMTTDRFAFAGDHLTANFNAQNYGGRIEGGWRFATFLGGVAPYAAVQAQSFHTPAYNETDATFGGFGLNYNARNGSDTRSELGGRFDHALPIATTAILALNARAAWAHDWVTTPVLNPLFQTLPGTLFSVTGATPVPNSALTSAGAELRFLGWTIGGRFDGEFANRAQTYAGTGTLRYTW